MTTTIQTIQAANATQRIDAADLPDILDERKGANFVTFVARVKETRVRKTAKVVCPSCNGSKTQQGVAKIIKCRTCKGTGTAIKRHSWGVVSKISLVNGQINWSYERAVRNRQEKLGLDRDFESAGRQWGVRVKGTPFVAHKGKQYVEVRILNILKQPEYLAEDGTTIPEADIKPFLAKKPEGERQQDADIPEDEVIFCRDYGLTDQPDGWGILKLSINGEVYEVE